MVSINLDKKNELVEQEKLAKEKDDEEEERALEGQLNDLDAR